MLHMDISGGVGMRSPCPCLGAIISRSTASHGGRGRVRRVGGRGGGCQGNVGHRRLRPHSVPVSALWLLRRAVPLPRPTHSCPVSTPFGGESPTPLPKSIKK